MGRFERFLIQGNLAGVGAQIRGRLPAEIKALGAIAPCTAADRGA